jgi:hypothetical protein
LLAGLWNGSSTLWDGARPNHCDEPEKFGIISDQETDQGTVNASISENSYKWTAGTLASASLDRQAFFFRLRNAQEEGGAYVDSSDILVLPAAAAASITGIKTSTAAPTSTGTGAATTSTGASTGASTMVTSTSSSASSSGASSSSASAATAAVTNPAGGAAAAGAGADTAKDPYKGIDYTSSFIGVGVGLGVPALLAALAAAFLMIRKRKASGESRACGAAHR